jgi:D-arabinose 1-dehydrogenase-like Zn-dependent alcohol dehydrogenase
VVQPTPPFVPGHEGIGIIEALGAWVANRRIGGRDAIPWLGYGHDGQGAAHIMGASVAQWTSRRKA